MHFIFWHPGESALRHPPTHARTHVWHGGLARGAGMHGWQLAAQPPIMPIVDYYVLPIIIFIFDPNPVDKGHEKFWEDNYSI